MGNIFENAYFGKPYKTRDGRKAVLISYNQRKPNEPYVCAVACYLDGRVKSNCHNFNELGKTSRNGTIRNDDIVSEWQEPINEEELTVLAIKDINEMVLKGKEVTATELWKAGYCKAMEE